MECTPKCGPVLDMKEYTFAKYVKELGINSVPPVAIDRAVADAVVLKIVWKLSA